MGDRLLKESDVLRLMVRYPIPNSMFYKDVKMLPSADKPKGEWKVTPLSTIMYCSNCDVINEYNIYFDFCPNCGADMRDTEHE